MLDEICDCLARGETVKLSSFGSFLVRDKGQRVGRNPKTGVEVPIQPRRVMVFKPSNVLKARINGGEGDRGDAVTARAPTTGRRQVRARRRTRSAPSARSPTDLDLPQHVLRFWETRFPQIKPLKRGGGRRYYRPDDVDLLRGIRELLYGEGYTIKGVQRILREDGPRVVQAIGRGEAPPLPEPPVPAAMPAGLDEAPAAAVREAGPPGRPAQPGRPVRT